MVPEISLSIASIGYLRFLFKNFIRALFPPLNSASFSTEYMTVPVSFADPAEITSFNTPLTNIFLPA